MISFFKYWGRREAIQDSFYSIDRLKKYDLLTAIYLIFWILLIFFNYSSITGAFLFLTLHVVVLILVFILGGVKGDAPVLKFIQHWYPFMFLPLFFTALHYLIPVIHPQNLDQILINIDRLLTGTDPTVWLERFYNPFLVEIMQLSYLTFYFLPLLILIPLYFRKDYGRFEQLGFSFLLTFYLSYFGYLMFPALGPRYFLAHEQSIILDGTGIYHSISTALNGLENIQWDAFPSGHVAIALVYSYFAFRFFRKTFYVTIPVVSMLILSTVYLRHHYVVDVMAGVMLFAIIILTDKLLYRNVDIR
jgi:membrane-associated phospholipid phosphatase